MESDRHVFTNITLHSTNQPANRPAWGGYVGAHNLGNFSFWPVLCRVEL